ncbi:methyltransferase domain-containing protein [Dactylosporangium siamense]|uniref:2-ketoarginine methyltransferase n=1 Tax=Dactylosporangium siamense TaxID=685454 RepID=A0A919PMW6_9ACTN|nr:methyltransferase domain-containing protein [Dactylosporangium siamense]GIG47685.1 2-ketoarginine methyltransferase [Dactylosporangium siamense]
MAEITPGLEKRLIGALQPIRGFVLAQALHQFMDTGIHDALTKHGALPVDRLAQLCGLSADRLGGFLLYLANEDFVVIAVDGTVGLTSAGAEIGVFQPWYALLVGGYTPAFAGLREALADPAAYASRNAAQVGVGSCGISEYDALPIAERLFQQIPGRVGTVVDLGCGDGRYLAELCDRNPGLRGVGVELAEQSVTNARRLMQQRGLAERVAVVAGRADDPPDLADRPGPLCFITAFVLQEILEQRDRAAILELLCKVFARHPDASWIVIEVDHRPADPDVMGHDLGLAYYNPYYLIHRITEQRLETRRFWEDLFAEAGLSVVGPEVPDPVYDSLGLKLGYLLRAAGAPAIRADL